MSFASIHRKYFVIFFTLIIGIEAVLSATSTINGNYSIIVNNLSKLQTIDFSNVSFVGREAFMGENIQTIRPIQEQNLISNSDFVFVQQENKLEFDDDSNEEIPLLPQNISFTENLLWGEKGLFRRIGITSDLSPDQRQKELGWRRTFLTIHQTTGLVSWGLMASTVITGQMWLDGKMDSPIWHKRLLYSTIATYSLTGLLAIITPPPFERRNEFSSISFHKLAAWIHFAGMIATPILGKMINTSNDYYQSARLHQTMGYITFSVYSAAMLGIILFE